jgi:hypothetical protein
MTNYSKTDSIFLSDRNRLYTPRGIALRLTEPVPQPSGAARPSQANRPPG